MARDLVANLKIKGILTDGDQSAVKRKLKSALDFNFVDLTFEWTGAAKIRGTVELSIVTQVMLTTEEQGGVRATIENAIGHYGRCLVVYETSNRPIARPGVARVSAM